MSFEQDESQQSEPRERLLRKYDIPITYLDYEHVAKCANGRELEKILHVLQSGEEGYYPDLMQKVEEKLAKIKPNSRFIRKATEVLDRKQLGGREQEQLIDDVTAFISNVNLKNEELNAVKKRSVAGVGAVPDVRKSKQVDNEANSKCKGDQKRIKSTDYSTWDKYDPDAEILKMELETEKMKKKVEQEEKKKSDKSKLTVTFNEFTTDAEASTTSDAERAKGNEFFRVGDYDLALTHYTNSIKFKPSASNYNNRAATYLKLNKPDLTIKDCQSVLKYESHNVKAMYRMAQAYEAIKDYEKALKAAEEAVRIEPNNTAVQSFINNLVNKKLVVRKQTPKTRMKILDALSVEPKKNGLKVELKTSPTYIELSIPGPSNMREPYFILVDNNADTVKLQQQIVNSRRNPWNKMLAQFSKLTTTVASNDEDEDCTEIHIGNVKCPARWVPKYKMKPASKLYDKRKIDLVAYKNLVNSYKNSNDTDNANNNHYAKLNSDDINGNQEENANYDRGAGGEECIPENVVFNSQFGDLNSPFNFYKMWRNVARDNTNQGRADLLRHLETNRLPQIIGHKLDGNLFSEIIVTIYQHFTVAHEVDRVHQLLTALPTTPRFSIAKLFLSESDKKLVKNIFQFLEQHGRPLPQTMRDVYF